MAHLPLHLVHRPLLELPLTDNPTRLVRVSVVADYLGGNHEGRDEQAVFRGREGGGEARFNRLRRTNAANMTEDWSVVR